MNSKAAVIYNALLLEYPQAMQEITLLSKNTQANREFVICNVIAFNFDAVVNVSMDLPDHKEQSPDALFLHDDTLYFIEFKEGKGKNVDKTDIREKIHEAIITLFQYTTKNKLATRAEFLELSIKYAVVMRPKVNGKPPSTFLTTLEKSAHYFNLKNMEGLLLKGTSVFFTIESIYKLLNKVSNDAVRSIKIMDGERNKCEAFPI